MGAAKARRWICWTAMLALAAALLPAQTSPSGVDAILERCIRAVGGRAAVERVTSRVMKGSLVTPGGAMTLEIYEKAPNKFLRILENPASGRSENGFDGQAAWSRNPQRGLRDVTGPEVENFKREQSLHRQILWKELYPEMRAAGQETLDGRETDLVEAQAGPEVTYKLYFDRENGLLLRSDVSMRGVTIHAYFEDYRDVDGVKLAFTIRRVRSSDGFQWSDRFTEIRHNVPIEDAKFAKPVQETGAPAAQAQRRDPIPDTFTNLQVLPKEISKPALVGIMKNFCFTMNQRCSYCHVATDDLSSADFPSDEKETKKKARELLRNILAAMK